MIYRRATGENANVRSERNYLIRHVARQRFIQIREAADRRSFDQFVSNLTLVAALIATHQQHPLALCHSPESVRSGSLNQDIVVVFEKKIFLRTTDTEQSTL
jgi:hypothetical protein